MRITLGWLPARALLVLALALGTSAVAGCDSGRASVWVENRSPDRVALFVTDLSDQPAAWYSVPGNTTAHLGSGGLHISDAVRVNVLGWRTEECSPSHYDDTLYNVPRGSSVR